jgi:hypothetical protein
MMEEKGAFRSIIKDVLKHIFFFPKGQSAEGPDASQP